MKIHSDTLGLGDLRNTLPASIELHAMPAGSRSRQTAFIVSLEFTGTPGRGRRKANGGRFGAGYHWAATWDEWGVWMARLFDIDPNAIIGNYKGVSDFMDQTAKYQPRGMLAPWLKMHV